MTSQRCPEEFKIQAVNQVTEKQLPVSGEAARLGVSVHSLYTWIKRYPNPRSSGFRRTIRVLSLAAVPSSELGNRLPLDHRLILR